MCEGLNGYDGPLFALTYENAGRTCSVPVPPELEECCCTTVEPVLMEVRSDPPVELAECEEAIVSVDGRSVFVQVRGAARSELWQCGDDGDATRAAGLAVAIIE